MTIMTDDRNERSRGRFEACMIITSAIMTHERPTRQSEGVRVMRRAGITLERGIRLNAALRLLPETGEIGVLQEPIQAYNPLPIATFLDGIEEHRFRWTFQEIADLFRFV